MWVLLLNYSTFITFPIRTEQKRTENRLFDKNYIVYGHTFATYASVDRHTIIITIMLSFETVTSRNLERLRNYVVESI